MVALPILLELAALIVALGLIYCGKGFVDALLWIVRASTKALPFSGFLVGALSERALQKLSNVMGGLANDVGASVSASWHFLAQIVDRLAWTTFHTAVALNRLFAYVTVGYPLHVMWALAKRAEALALRAGHAVGHAPAIPKIIYKAATAPKSSPLAPAIRAITKPLAAELHRFEAWTRHAIAVAGGAVIHVPTKVGTGWKDLRNIRTRLRRVEHALTGLGAIALVGTALARMGLGWLRCRNVKRTGKAICGMDAGVLESLLLDASALTIAFNIEAFARELQGITGGVAHAIRDFAE